MTLFDSMESKPLKINPIKAYLEARKHREAMNRIVKEDPSNYEAQKMLKTYTYIVNSFHLSFLALGVSGFVIWFLIYISFFS